MRREFLILSLLLLISVFKVQKAYAQQSEGRSLVNALAVAPLVGRGISETEATILSDRLRAELIKTRAYPVMERQEMDEILKEQGFQLSGTCLDSCVVNVGRLVGVRKIVGGSVGKLGGTYTVQARIFDVESSQIDNEVVEDYKGNIEGLLNVIGRVARELIPPPKPEPKPKQKSRLTAAAFSAVFPGAGQFYLGRKTKGAVISLAEVAAIGTVIMLRPKYISAVDRYKLDKRNYEGFNSTDPDSVKAKFDKWKRSYNLVTSKKSILFVAVGLTGVVWLYNVVDSAIVGRKPEEGEKRVSLIFNSEDSAVGLMLRVTLRVFHLAVIISNSTT